ncbi:MAG: type II secretion system protein F, partial [Mesorhizobium sp.]
APAEQALQGLLRERGLTASGDYIFGMIALNRLYTQSGVTGNPLVFASLFLLAGLALALMLPMMFGFSSVAGLLVFLIVGIALPLLVLRRARNKR